MTMLTSDKRPKHLNLAQIRLPLPGIVSILHRASGLILVVALPFALAALQCSIASQEGYDAVAALGANPFAKIAIWGAAWALFHHLCAGARFLLLDFHIGVDLASARRSAMVAIVAGVVLTALFGAWLWG